MNTSLYGRNLIRTGALAAATLAFATFARAYDVPIAPELDGNSAKSNWISLSVGAFNSDGSMASLQRVRQHEDVGFVGVDSMHYTKSLSGDRKFTLDGKAIVGDNEYYVGAMIEDESTGWYMGAGYRESRVFYDGSGGYTPGGLWIQPHDDQLYVDRGEIWAVMGLNQESWNFKIRGSHSYRKGAKDSTMWGDSIYSGLGTASRKTVPALLEIDEYRDTLEVDLGFTGEQVQAGAGGRIETINTDNKTTILRNPGQANPTGSGQRYQITKSGSNADLFAGHVFAVTQVGDRLTLSGAGSMTSMDTILSGDRYFAATPDGVYSRTFPRASTAHGYNGLTGETQWDQWVLTGNAVFIPAKNWTINGGVRYENQTQDSFSEYIETAGPATAPFEEPFEQEGEREFDELLATIEFNFNGINNVVITPFAEYSAGEGTLIEEQMEGHPPTQVVVIDRDTEYERAYSKYGISARWYPATWANAGAGLYRKERNNLYETVADNTPPVGGNRYPAFIADQDFVTDDIYVKGTIRPTTGLSITGRWDRQRSEIETTEQLLAPETSAEQNIDIASATLSWSVAPNVMMQVGMNMVFDETLTGALGATSAVSAAIGKFSSDYTTYNAMMMVALDEDTDLQFDYYGFMADNYRTVYAASLPYGRETQESTYGATYSKKISADMIFSLRLVYCNYVEDSSGGHQNFDSSMIYGRLQMRF